MAALAKASADLQANYQYYIPREADGRQRMMNMMSDFLYIPASIVPGFLEALTDQFWPWGCFMELGMPTALLAASPPGTKMQKIESVGWSAVIQSFF